jgi:hypothetical protein
MSKVNAGTGWLKKNKQIKKNTNDVKIRSEQEWALPAHWTCTPHGAQRAAAWARCGSRTIFEKLMAVHSS